MATRPPAELRVAADAGRDVKRAPGEDGSDVADGALARGSVAKRRVSAFAIIAVVALMQVMAQYAFGRDRGRFGFHLGFMLMHLPLLMLLLSGGFRFATRKQWRAVPTVLAGVLFAGVMGAGLGAFASYVMPDPNPPPAPRNGPFDRPEQSLRLPRGLFFGFVSGQIDLGLWALAFVFPFALEDARVRALAADKLRLEADKLRLEADTLRTTAELARLRAHLEPHFLLNTLNAIGGLVTEEPREARRLLACLGDLLRDALRDEGEMQTLDDQVRWLQRYAEILEARHAGALTFDWQIANDTRGLSIPRLLLQPLVENAVKHGALRRPSSGRVTVRAERVHDAAGIPTLLCTIEDNGPGIPKSEIRSGAFGLHVVRRRLELKYLGQAALTLESSPEGTRSLVRLPSQRLGASGGAAALSHAPLGDGPPAAHDPSAPSPSIHVRPA